MEEPDRGALDAQVEVGRPDERQHVTGEAADQAHQDGEVRHEDRHQHGKNDVWVGCFLTSTQSWQRRRLRDDLVWGVVPRQTGLERF